MNGLIKRSPKRAATRTRSPFGHVFDDFLADFTDEFARWPELWREGRFMPAMDVTEDEKGYAVTAEVPGMSREDLEVSVHDGVLTIQGEKKHEEESAEAGRHVYERRYGRFERHIRLPESVDAEGVAAECRDGVLRLTLPKVEPVKPKSIEIA